VNNLNEFLPQVRFVDLKNGRWVCTASLSVTGPVLRAYGYSPDDALRNLVEIWDRQTPLKYKVTYTPIPETDQSRHNTESRATMDWGTDEDIKTVDDFFMDLFHRESTNIRQLGLDPRTLTFSISKLECK
jgi:hypothetical protein